MWHRLCVDVDTAGNVLGCSIEHHDDVEGHIKTEMWSAQHFSAFVTPQEVWDFVRGKTPTQGVLFPPG